MNEGENTLNNSIILKALLDNSPEGILLLSTDHKVIFFNDEIKLISKLYFGKELKLGDDFRTFVTPGSMELYLDSFNKANKGETTLIEINVKTTEGTVWFEYKMGPIYDAEEKLLGITFYTKNINQRKKSEIELEEMAKNFKAIFDNVDESIFLLDRNLKVLRYNNYGYERLKKNINKEIFIGADFNDFIYPGQAEVFIELFNKALSGSNVKKEIRVHVGDYEAWFLSKMFPVYDRNGDLLGVSVYAVNIHDRKIAEIALKESEEKFRSIVRLAPTPIIMVNKDLKIVLSNPETAKVFGYSSDELKNHNINLLLPNDSYVDLIDYLKNGSTTNEDQRLGDEDYIITSKKSGEEIYIEIGLKNIQVNKEDLILIIILDVTERIKAEQKILNQVKRLEAIAWEQSHELRRPVANILGIVNLFKTTKNLSETDKHKFFESLYMAAEDLDKVIHKIVDYTSEEK